MPIFIPKDILSGICRVERFLYINTETTLIISFTRIEQIDYWTQFCRTILFWNTLKLKEYSQ